MGLFHKKKTEAAEYDKEREYPIVHSSICTGEKVFGFKDKETGKFRDVMLIKNDKDIEDIKLIYGIDEIKTEY